MGQKGIQKPIKKIQVIMLICRNVATKGAVNLLFLKENNLWTFKKEKAIVFSSQEEAEAKVKKLPKSGCLYDSKIEYIIKP